MKQEDIKTKLKKRLREIFQIEDPEYLDFGIYRVMNIKRAQIEKFIEKDLIEEVQNQLEILSEEKREKIKKEAEELKRKIIENIGEDAFKNGELTKEAEKTKLGKKYLEVLERIEKVKVSEDVERQIYEYILNFFSRYYDKGDFISLRRYGRDESYVIPYNGEEVLLYWANNDQYYIKTTEYFRKYSFETRTTQGILKVNFRVVEAQEEKGNVKSNAKMFVLDNEKPFEWVNDNELNIFFQFRELTEEEKEKYGQNAKQDNINKFILEKLKKDLEEDKRALPLFIKEKKKEKKKEKTVLERQLYKYTRRNTSDYFIHKDLKRFLERELDFYIKNKVLKLEDINRAGEKEMGSHLLKAKVFQNIARKIIDFLAQIEDFQKKIWEKKKFVIQTDYVITLDKIKEYAGEEFLESILDQISKNENQLKEWKELIGFEVKTKDDLIEKQQNLKGKEWKKLPIDTKYFDDEFKWKLLIALSNSQDLDEILDGVLVKSENWQALNLLKKKYEEKIKTIYIDPPYNTGNDEFLYKDNYQHSSWLTMMENRLRLARELMRSEGVIFASSDDNEQIHLKSLLELTFGASNVLKTIPVIMNLKGNQDEFGFAGTHEYVQIAMKEKSFVRFGEFSIDEETLDKWRIDEYGYYKKGANLKATGRNAPREKRPNLFFPIYVTPTGEINLGRKSPDDIELLPITDGKEMSWRWGKEKIQQEKHNLIVIRSGDVINIYKKQRPKIGDLPTRKPKSVLYKPEYSSGNGTIQIKHLFGDKVYTDPKPIDLIADYCIIGGDLNSIILDFFAGSGTTAHAVMKLNKEDNGKRKFTLVEMADYFDTVIIPRIKKVAYSFNWKEGKPQDADGIGVFFKYHTLEQYEDSLGNIDFEQKTLPEFGDYFVKYMLEFESKKRNTFLNIDKMEDPFNYKLEIMEDYKTKTVKVDLIETFNYLIGLSVGSYKVLEDNGRKYFFISGESEKKKTLVVWRTTKDIDFKKDKEIIESEIRNTNPEIIYVNGDCGVKGFRHIESTFKSKMWEK